MPENKRILQNKKVKVIYMTKFNDEWFHKIAMFDNWDDAIEYMTNRPEVWKFELTFVKK